MPRILIIEDDVKTAHAICAGLQGEGFDAVTANSGETGLEQLDSALRSTYAGTALSEQHDSGEPLLTGCGETVVAITPA